MHESYIFSEACKKIQAYIQSNDDCSAPVVKFKYPGKLSEKIDFEIPREGVSEVEFLQLLDKYLELSVRTGNKQFNKQG